MAAEALKRAVPRLGPYSAGSRLTVQEFQRADFDELWRYELIDGVLIVTPIPLVQETDPNEELGHWLRTYRDSHPQGSALDATLPEQYVKTGTKTLRRADRVIWAGLGRMPRRLETPTIIAEFVSAGKRGHVRDYEEKRREYLAINVQEYWVIDRFARTMTVFTRSGGRLRKQIIREGQTYTTALLPGFELPLTQLLRRADQWPEEPEVRPAP